MNEDAEIDSMIDDLVSLGALRRDSSGSEIIYYVNSDRMQEVFPEFYEMFRQEVDQEILSLMEMGLVKIEYNENLKAMISLTEEGEKYIDNIILSDRPYDI